MRTLENYSQNIKVSKKVEGFEVFIEIEIEFNRHLYRFEFNNWQAYNRITRKDFVKDKQRLYGYTLKGAYEAFYKEFAKLRKVHSDKLDEIIR